MASSQRPALTLLTQGKAPFMPPRARLRASSRFLGAQFLPLLLAGERRFRVLQRTFCRASRLSPLTVRASVPSSSGSAARSQTARKIPSTMAGDAVRLISCTKKRTANHPPNDGTQYQRDASGARGITEEPYQRLEARRGPARDGIRPQQHVRRTASTHRPGPAPIHKFRASGDLGRHVGKLPARRDFDASARSMISSSGKLRTWTRSPCSESRGTPSCRNGGPPSLCTRFAQIRRKSRNSPVRGTERISTGREPAR
jgi:hypothetical protein